jgi:hypothetical protein
VAGVRDTQHRFERVGSIGWSGVSDEEVVAGAIDEQVREVAQGQ